MRGEEDAALLARRLDELAARAERIGQPCFTGFLTPPEADMALASARRQRIEIRRFDIGMPRDTHAIATHFVGHDEHNVGFLVHTPPHAAA